MADTAVIYLRVSSQKQEDNYSLGDQLSMSTAHCEQRDYDVLEVHQDVYTGHADESERPGLARALHAIEIGTASVLVVAKGDRLSREDDSPLAYYERIAKKYGARIEYVKPSLLAGTKFAGLGREIESFMNAEERERIRERTMGGMQARIAAGKYRPAPFSKYGYVLVDGIPALDPETAPIIRRIFEEVASGKTLRQVALDLTSDGVPTPSMLLSRGGLWNDKDGNPRKPQPIWLPNVMSNLTTDPRYYGDLQVNRRHASKARVRTANGTIKVITRVSSGEEVVHLPCPAIVSKELWDAVQQVRKTNKARAARNNRQPAQTLLRAGIAYCGYCYRPLYCQFRRNRKHTGSIPYYYCWHTERSGYTCPCGSKYLVGAESLDREIWEAYIAPLLGTPDALQKAVEFRLANQEQEQNRIAVRQESVQESLAEKEREQDNLLETLAHLANAAARTALAAKLDVLSSEIEGLHKRMVTLSTRRAEAELKESAWDKVTANIERWQRDAQDMTYEEKRALLYALGVRVYCFRMGDQEAYEAFHPDVQAIEWELEAPTTSHLFRLLFFAEDALRAAGVPVDTEYLEAAKGSLTKEFRQRIDSSISRCYAFYSALPILSWGDVLRFSVVL